MMDIYIHNLIESFNSFARCLERTRSPKPEVNRWNRQSL